MRRSLCWLMVVLVGCAHGLGAGGGDAWHSPEGLGDARWGMTPEELLTAVGPAEQLGPERYRLHQPIDGQPSMVTYDFVGGHLASATVQADSNAGNPAAYDERFQALRIRYGEPLPPPGSRDNTGDDVLTAVAIIGALVLVGVLVVALAGKGGAGGAGHLGAGFHGAAPAHAALPPPAVSRPGVAAGWVALDTLRLSEDALVIASMAPPPGVPGAPPPPAGGWVAEWKTPETHVLLLGANLGQPDATVVECYRSLRLAQGPR
jgi:hypothetical protein